ncbi:MAG TPA: CPBP family intramembrane glutamic endopeptidase [Sedimentisphaerales bacterium]|nr:CPBP family intramembrane glutamic endopeptidase [Sedimentisphaerales bacterium]
MSNESVDSTHRPFSLWLYILIVFALSWPLLIVAAIWGTELLPRYILHATSMCMVTAGTYIAGRYVFRDGFAGAGWRWGRPKHYAAVIGLALLLWAVPTIVDLAAGTLTLPTGLTGTQIIWIFVLIFVTLIPGFGEEFGWRGYMLPHLARRYTPRKAVIIHSFVWWAWHLPVLAGVAVHSGLILAAEKGLPAGATVTAAVITVVLVGAIPAMLHGVVFAYIWTRTGSLAVATVYHAAYDGVRDSIQTTVGSGPVSGLWSVALLIVLGIVFLWKGNWGNLKALPPVSEPLQTPNTPE